jgi:drug/metabolite transporter (DMT)-like permease
LMSIPVSSSPRKHFGAVALLLVTALLWSIGGVLIKLVDWNPIAIAASRSAFAIPVVLLWAGLPKRPIPPLHWVGAIAYASTVILFVAATRLTTAANAIFLQYTAPIYVALLAPLVLGEKSRRSDWVTVGFALAGIGLFFVEQLSLTGLTGNILAILSGASFAAMTLCLRKARAGNPLRVVLLGNIITALIGVPFVLRAGLPVGADWLPLLTLGVFQLGLSYVLFTVAIRHVTALEAALITVLEPVLNPIWVIMSLGERPGPWAILGGGLVLASVLVRGILNSQRAGRP